METKSILNMICNDINRRLFTMDYKTESIVREYLHNIFCYSSTILECESNRLAEILDVNETCVFDLLSNLDLIEQ